MKLVHISGTEWDQIATDFYDALQEQRYCFNAARWGLHRVECAVLKDKGSIVAGAVVIIFRLPGLDRGLAILKWGPVWRKQGSGNDPDLFQSTLIEIKREYVNRRGFFLTYMPPADPRRENPWRQIIQTQDFKPGNRLPYPDRYFVNLSINMEEQQKSLHHKWRYNLKKAQKNELEIRLIDNPNGLDQFMGLYRQMITRKKFSDYSMVHTLPALYATNTPAFKPKVVLVYYQGKPTAGAVIDTHGDCATYLYGATDDRALPLKAGYVLHWWIVEWLKATSNARWYDLGGTDGFQGLHQFKKGIVGQRGCIMPIPEEYHCCESIVSFCLSKSLYAIKDVQKAFFRVRDRFT